MSDSSTSPRKPQNGPLKKGWTTGACATAAAAAAYRALLTKNFENRISITLPRGHTPCFELDSYEFTPLGARASVIKDAGDDPDVTHGLKIFAEVEHNPEGKGITYTAGNGVGTITLPGLPLPVGQPAINPGPRQQIEAAILAVAQELEGAGAHLPDLNITISVPGGEEVALNTMNPRLGILGGISILGTTGIVVPFSCSSWIHSIHRGVDVARAQGFNHILAATGRTSESAANARLELPDQALIDMGDFAGGLLKYLRDHPIEQLTIAGGFAKMTKLAQGAMDLHSSRSRVDFERLAATLEQCGGTPEVVNEARSAVTAMHVLELAGDLKSTLADHIARQAREVAMATLAGGVNIDIWAYDRQGNRVGISS